MKKIDPKQLYRKVICLNCGGTGIINSWHGPCWKCSGKGYQFVEVKKDESTDV